MNPVGFSLGLPIATAISVSTGNYVFMALTLPFGLVFSIAMD